MTKVWINCLHGLRMRCNSTSGAQVETDPSRDGEENSKTFSPLDLFSASLGSCILTLMRIRANELGIHLKELKAEVEKKMVVAPKRKVEKITVRIQSSYLPSKIEQEKLEKAAIDCPLHLTLNESVKVELNFLWGL